MEEPEKDRRRIARPRPVFGSATMIGGRTDLQLPVSLVPTAMAGEMGNAWLAGSNASRGAAGTCASPVQSGERAELIGQEELPLRAALAARGDAPDIRADVECIEEDQDRELEALPSADAVETAAISAAVVQIRSVPGRGGRPAGPERYPFGELSPVSVDEGGKMSGPCFLIPDTDDPERHIAAGRKRHRGKTFITRGVPGGTMIWRLR